MKDRFYIFSSSYNKYRLTNKKLKLSKYENFKFHARLSRKRIFLGKYVFIYYVINFFWVLLVIVLLELIMSRLGIVKPGFVLDILSAIDRLGGFTGWLLSVLFSLPFYLLVGAVTAPRIHKVEKTPNELHWNKDHFISVFEDGSVLDWFSLEKIVISGDYVKKPGDWFPLRIINGVNQIEFIDMVELHNEYYLSGGSNLNGRDSMFADAARIVVRHQLASTSLIQRELEIGYNRAGQIMDQLEESGVVSPNFGDIIGRHVLFNDEISLARHLFNLN